MMEVGATWLAQGRIDEFVSDPVLTVACVLLVAVSIGWIVTSRAITKNMLRAAERQRRRPPQPRRRSPDTRTQPTRRVPPSR
ncbi:MAG: hypothetical protein M3516_07200 [Actinomycetota bacterium]|nr:hypothetical protein [Actinomycetota bacterium]